MIYSPPSHAVFGDRLQGQSGTTVVLRKRHAVVRADSVSKEKKSEKNLISSHSAQLTRTDTETALGKKMSLKPA